MLSEMISLPRLPARLTHVPLMLAAVAVLASCGTTLYISKIRQANEAFEQAKAVGAETRAPYEYYGAEVRLEEAKRLAAVAEYGTAVKLAEEARLLSETAIQEIEAKTKGKDLKTSEKARETNP